MSLVYSTENPSETPLSSWKAELFEQRRLRVLRDTGLVKNKNQSKMKKSAFFIFSPLEYGRKNRYRLDGGAGEEGAASSGRAP